MDIASATSDANRVNAGAHTILESLGHRDTSSANFSISSTISPGVSCSLKFVRLGKAAQLTSLGCTSSSSVTEETSWCIGEIFLPLASLYDSRTGVLSQGTGIGPVARSMNRCYDISRRSGRVMGTWRSFLSTSLAGATSITRVTRVSAQC